MQEPADNSGEEKKSSRTGITVRDEGQHQIIRTSLLPSAKELALLAGSILLAIVLAEVTYRAYVGARVYIHQVQSEAELKPSFGFTYPSPYVYHRELGYQHPPGLRYAWGGVDNGVLTSCNVDPYVNARGNSGAIKGKYEEADLKILVFGDSFSAVQDNWGGVTWPHQLQLNLEKRLGRSVHVINFARPGQGVLEMISHGAYYLPKLKPDLAIVAYISDDLQRNRHWRKVIQGKKYERMLMSRTPDFEPELSQTFDATLLNSKVTRDWCKEIQALASQWHHCKITESRRLNDERQSNAARDKNAQRLNVDDDNCPPGRLKDDPIVIELIEQYRYLHTENCRWALGKNCNPFDINEPVFLSLNGSMLYDRIVHGSAFASIEPVRIFRSFSKKSYSEDARFVRELELIAKTGIPFHFVHLQTAHEASVGKEYDLTTTQERLNKSLEELTAQPVLGLATYIDIDDPSRMVINAEMGDFHPNSLGIQIYADAVARLLIDKGLLPSAPSTGHGD